MAKGELYNSFTLLLSSYLPNVEHVIDRNLNTYIAILYALQNSNLRLLNMSEPPCSSFGKGEDVNYTSTALLMKDRLEYLLLSDNFKFSDGINGEHLLYNRSYNRLNQFDRLKNLNIKRCTDKKFQELDYLIESCRSLEILDFDFTPLSNIATPDNSISIDAISNFTARPDIKRLKARRFFSDDYKSLKYIMHKFPQLTSLEFDMTTIFPHKLNQESLIELFHYFSGINELRASQITIDHDIITDAIGSCWNATSTAGSEQVEFCCSKGLSDITIDVSKVEWGKMISIAHPELGFELMCNNFILQNGSFIQSLILSSQNFGTAVLYQVPDRFIFQALSYCSFLRTLDLCHCNLNQSVYSTVDFSEQRSLDTLSLRGCTINSGVLEQLSLLLEEIKKLEIIDVTYRKNENEVGKPITEIVMPHTKVNFIEIHGQYPNAVPLYIKIFVIGPKQHYSYRCYLSESYPFEEDLKLSNEQEYMGASGDDKCFYICCQTVPKIIFC